MSDHRDPAHHAALAYLIHAIRPDWDRPGIEHVLARANPQADLRALMDAASKATTRTDQKSPGIIAMSGAHWDTSDRDPGRAATPSWSDPFPEEDALRDLDRIAEITRRVRPMREILSKAERATELPE